MSKIARTFAAACLSVAALSASAGPVTGQGTWETTLKARDINGNAVALNDPTAAFFYDTTLNVTWLADMNANGPMNWDQATAWAAALTTGDYSDWRMPNMIDSGTPGCNFSFAGGTDCGFNVQTQVDSAYSEWAHLYYVTLGNLAYCPPGDATCAGGPQGGWGLSNTAYFDNMQSEADYWTDTEYALDASRAWCFNTAGGQSDCAKNADGSFYAVAVRPGDVLAEVPEPHALALALMALGVLVVARRRRAH